jgi:hypothetical protein
MAEVQHDVKTAEASRQHLAEFMSSGITKKPAAIKSLQNIHAPAIRPVLQRPSAPELPPLNVPQVPKINIPQAPKANVAQPPQPR